MYENHEHLFFFKLQKYASKDLQIQSMTIDVYWNNYKPLIPITHHFSPLSHQPWSVYL